MIMGLWLPVQFMQNQNWIYKQKLGRYFVDNPKTNDLEGK